MTDRGPHADRHARRDREGGDEVHDSLRPRGEGQRALDLVGTEPGLAIHRHVTHDRSIVRGLRTGVRLGRVSDAEVLPSAVAWLATERAPLDTEVTRLVTRDAPWPDGTPCWVDLGAKDIAKAISFYS